MIRLKLITDSEYKNGIKLYLSNLITTIWLRLGRKYRRVIDLFNSIYSNCIKISELFLFSCFCPICSHLWSEIAEFASILFEFITQYSVHFFILLQELIFQVIIRKIGRTFFIIFLYLSIFYSIFLWLTLDSTWFSQFLHYQYAHVFRHIFQIFSKLSFVTKQ